MSGVLSFCVLEGRNLPAMDANGASDPYVTLNYGQYEHKSHVVKADLFPHWIEEKVFAALPHAEMLVAVFDQDKISKDDKMGNFKINADTLHDGKMHDEWFPLAKGGQVRLRWRYVPHISDPALAPTLIRSQKHSFVSKKSGKMGKWLPRWAELRDDYLLLSSNPGDKHKPKSISLQGAAISTTPDAGPNNQSVISIQTSSGFGKVRTWKLSFESADDTNSWATVLAAVSAGKTLKDTQATLIEQGVVFITLIEGKDLKNMDANGLSDPFTIIYVGNEQRRSTTQKNTLTPSWNENFDFFVEGVNHSINVLLLDEDPGNRADIMGQVIIPLKSVADRQPHDDWYDVIDAKTKKKHGSLRLAINFVYDLVDSRVERKVIGVSLVDLAARDGCDLPKVVDTMISFLEKHAVEQEGIFRISASANAVREGLILLDIGKMEWTPGHDDYTVAALLKSFLRSLPEPLLLNSLTSEWLAAKDVAQFKKLYSQLPAPHRAVLARLIKLMRLIVKNEDKSKMSLKNLCICIGPNLLHATDTHSPMDLVRLPDMLASLVTHFDSL